MAHRMTGWTRGVILAGAAVALAGVAKPAAAADDGYENVFTSVLTAVGVMSPDTTPDIDYRERAPLVVPPKATLVKPETQTKRAANWPVDPDVARRNKAAADARAPMGDGGKNDRVLSKDEQLKFRAAQQDDFDPYGCSLQNNSPVHCRVSPDEMKREEEAWKKMDPGRRDKDDKVVAGEEPEREWLTQPPKGYLKATKDVKLTHEAPQPARDESSPLSTYIHPTTNNVDPLSK